MSLMDSASSPDLTPKTMSRVASASAPVRGNWFRSSVRDPVPFMIAPLISRGTHRGRGCPRELGKSLFGVLALLTQRDETGRKKRLRFASSVLSCSRTGGPLYLKELNSPGRPATSRPFKVTRCHRLLSQDTSSSGHFCPPTRTARRSSTALACPLGAHREDHSVSRATSGRLSATPSFWRWSTYRRHRLQHGATIVA